MASCKYYKQVRQVSYDSGVTWISLDEYRKGDLYETDSPDCGGGITQYRWVNVSGEYTCVGTTKYQKTKKQQSRDGGQTWTDVNPPEYSTGAVIERDSSDCQTPPPSPYESQYLTLVARGSGGFRLSSATTFQYSKDEGNTWTNATSATTISVSNGDRVMFKGTLSPSIAGIGIFSANTQFEAEGNPMSLLYDDNFIGQTSTIRSSFFHLFSGCTSLTNIDNLRLVATTLTDGCYEEMFYGCTSLTSIPSGFLPATTMKSMCYYYMFANCTSLTSIPSNLLPATTLSNSCYGWMFYNCTSLASIPSGFLPATTLDEECYVDMFRECTSLTSVPTDLLPSTTLAQSCYSGMFQGCTSLTTTPQLLASTLPSYCYSFMFYGCSRLNYVKCLATDITANRCTRNWLNGVASSGTFVKASSMSEWSSGASGVPNNWTVQNA